MPPMDPAEPFAVRLSKSLAHLEKRFGDTGRAVQWLMNRNQALGASPFELIRDKPDCSMLRQALCGATIVRPHQVADRSSSQHHRRERIYHTEAGARGSHGLHGGQAEKKGVMPSSYAVHHALNCKDVAGS